MKEKVSRTVVSDSAIPRTAACPAPLSVELSRQQYWSVLPFPSPGDLPNLGIKPGSPALQADALPSEPPGKPTGFKSKFYQMLKKCNTEYTSFPAFILRKLTQS